MFNIAGASEHSLKFTIPSTRDTNFGELLQALALLNMPRVSIFLPQCRNMQTKIQER